MLELNIFMFLRRINDGIIPTSYMQWGQQLAKVFIRPLGPDMTDNIMCVLHAVGIKIISDAS